MDNIIGVNASSRPSLGSQRVPEGVLMGTEGYAVSGVHRASPQALVVAEALRSLKLAGISKSAFIDLLELLVPEIYGHDAHEIDSVCGDNNSDLMCKVNPKSSAALFTTDELLRGGFARERRIQEGAYLDWNEGALSRQGEVLLGYERFRSLYERTRKFASRRGFEKKARKLSKKALTHGDLVYLVGSKHNNSTKPVMKLISSIASAIPGSSGIIGMLLDPDLHDAVMKSIHTERIESYRPHFDETYEAFVKRASVGKLYPIKLSGECLDVRQEENAIVLYFFGEGSSRLYTYEESYTIPDPRSLRDKLITFYGICHEDCGQYAAVPTSIILRLPFDEAELLGS